MPSLRPLRSSMTRCRLPTPRCPPCSRIRSRAHAPRTNALSNMNSFPLQLVYDFLCLEGFPDVAGCAAARVTPPPPPLNHNHMTPTALFPTLSPRPSAILAQEAALPSMPAIDSSVDVRARVREAVQSGDIKSGDIPRRPVAATYGHNTHTVLIVVCSDIVGEFI
jgi:hypothetical protein